MMIIEISIYESIYVDTEVVYFCLNCKDHKFVDAIYSAKCGMFIMGELPSP